MASINWVEIPVKDLERASTFYKNTFSVKIDYAQIEDSKHALITMEGSVGGILYESENIQQGVTIYFHVDRLNEILENALHFGGEIIQQKTLLKSYNTENAGLITNTMFDGKMGYYAKIKDSEGNILGLHSNS